ncbi:MAG: hypothetical protein H0V18_14435 [Pyrinomonadaceae bacterium]|nr:hypothetical protein [Pyrinomonadaceae bacterium]
MSAGILPLIRRLLIPDEGQVEEERLREQMVADVLRRGGSSAAPLGGMSPIIRNVMPTAAPAPSAPGDLPLRRTDQNGPIPVEPYARPDITPLIRQPIPLEPVPTEVLTRPRRVNAPAYDPTQVLTRPGVPVENQGEPFGLSGEPFGSTRLRRTQPRDYIADDTQYLRDLEANPKEMGRKKALALRVGLGLIGGGIPGAIYGAADEATTHQLGKRQQTEEIVRTQERLMREIGLQNTQADVNYKGSQADWMRQRPDFEAAKIADKNKVANQRILASILNARQEFDPHDPANASLVEALVTAQMPVVPKRRGQKLQYVHDERTGQWTIMSADPTSGQASSQIVPADENAPLTTTSAAQLGAEVQGQNRTSRERIAGAGRASRESIAASNMQSRETIAEKNRAYKPTRTPYTGRTMSAANLQRYARDKGLTPEQARAEVESQGIRVQ